MAVGIGGVLPVKITVDYSQETLSNLLTISLNLILANKNGPQIKAIKAMIDRITGNDRNKNESCKNKPKENCEL